MTAFNITAGFLLDLIFGDPAGFPHPVKFIGKLITILESVLRKMPWEKAAGLLLLVIVASSSYAAAYLAASISPAMEIFIIYTIFAVKSLGDETLKVHGRLAAGDLAGARREISMLVSRDTGEMEGREIARAAVETISENTVDGILSPMFYLFIGGAPLAMLFKAVSTLDSMVGYKNETYINFGMASARADDLMNFIPARIGSFIIIPAAAFFRGMEFRRTLKIMARDRLKHASPNSGHPEAAFAGALGCRLGGPSKYFGMRVDKPYIGDPVIELDKDTIIESLKLMYATSLAGLVAGIIITFTADWIAGGGIH